MLDIKDKRVIIVGTGKSGIGSTVLLEKNGALPLVYDSSEKTDKAAVKEFISEKLGWETKSELYTGVFPKERRMLSLQYLVQEFRRTRILCCI